ncbi:MAG: hypothetical protein HWE30_02250 [Methylocystaceae bacterium]|nr:hypothetical protein [Methylocystaceae bacterium]
MKPLSLLYSLCLGLFLTWHAQASESCKIINSFSGLIFDAGAFVGATDMEAHLDRALTYGVEKAVLFPHPDAQGGNHPIELEETFPDLVVRGNAPWSNASAVIWPEPISKSMFGHLETELARFPDRNYLLGHVSRFNLKTLERWLKTYPNLWIGFGKPEIDQMVENCGQGALSKLMRAASNRVVFASYGKAEGWENYKWTIRKLKKLAEYLSPTEADALLFKNAEELYKLSVNAP